MENTEPKLRPVRLRRLVEHVQTLPGAAEDAETRFEDIELARESGDDYWDQDDWNQCLAGHALRLYGNKGDQELLTGYGIGVSERAAELLGLTHLEANKLWYCRPNRVGDTVREILDGWFR
jgi:hypothetical protein